MATDYSFSAIQLLVWVVAYTKTPILPPAFEKHFPWVVSEELMISEVVIPTFKHGILQVTRYTLVLDLHGTVMVGCGALKELYVFSEDLWFFSRLQETCRGQVVQPSLLMAVGFLHSD